jgi:acylphosphatase
VVQGPEEAVEAVIAWASHGPPSAEVTSIDVENAEGTFTEFGVRRTE